MTDRVTKTVSRHTWMLLCDRVEALERGARSGPRRMTLRFTGTRGPDDHAQ